MDKSKQIEDAMEHTFKKQPRDHQDKTLKLLAEDKAGFHRPLFLVNPTGGGKSLIRDTLAVILRGVHLCIVPLLSLAADQTLKVLQHIVSGVFLMLIHLDDMWSEKENYRLRLVMTK